MADHDIVIRKYMEDKERFSDLMNGSLFGGKQVVKEENLEQVKGESDDEFLSGMKKEDTIYPVITVVIYYGEKEWDASIDIYGMMEIGRKGLITEELKEVLPNYKINLIHAGNIDNPEKYKSSLQLVFGMLKYKSDGDGLKKYLEEHRKELSSIDKETYDVMGILLHMEKELDDFRQKKGEKRDMCEAIRAMIEEGKNEGQIIGRIEKTIEMCQEFQASKEDTLERIIKEFSLEEAEAKQYMEEYWK